MKIYEVFFKNGKSYVFKAMYFDFGGIGRLHFFNEKLNEKETIAIFNFQNILGFVIKGDAEE